MTYPAGSTNAIISGTIERVTGAVAIIDSDHKYIHEGRLFESFVKTQLPANTGVFWIALTSPADLYNHYRPSNIVTSADKVTLELFEGGTFTSGTDATISNHNRLNGKVSKTTVKQGVSVTGGQEGTKLAQIYLPGAVGTGQTRTGTAFGPAANEWVMKRSTNYLIKVSNESTSVNDVQINFFWYEEEDA